jgi:hypothetical protein
MHVIGAVGRWVWLLAQQLLAGLLQLLAYRTAIPQRRPFGRRSTLSMQLLAYRISLLKAGQHIS